MNDPLGWFWEIPPVSRTYFTLSFLTTALCALEIVSPLTLYFNAALIAKGQLWRLVTSFLFFGLFSLDFVFHMYFLIRYCRLLEETSFRGPGRRADFLVFIAFCTLCMSLIAPFVNVPFMSSSLTFAMVHLWGRRNPHIRMSFLGLFPFTASYLSLVLFSFSLLLGHSAVVDLIGVAVGHVYYFFDDVYVPLAEIRGWAPKQYLRWTTYFPPEEEVPVIEAINIADFQPAFAPAAAAPPAGDGEVAADAPEADATAADVSAAAAPARDEPLPEPARETAAAEHDAQTLRRRQAAIAAAARQRQQQQADIEDNNDDENRA